MTVAATTQTATERAVEAIEQEACAGWNRLHDPADMSKAYLVNGILSSVAHIVAAFGPLVERALARGTSSPPSWRLTNVRDVQVLTDPEAVTRAIGDGWELITIAAHVNVAPEYHLVYKATSS